MNLQGVKLYTAEWHGESRGYKLDEAWSTRYLEECIKLGIKNIHVHKGPTIRPLDRDAFDVADVDKVATDYLELNFVVEHVGLPRLEDFCWIATQESNVYGGLAVAIPFTTPVPDTSRRSSASCCTGSARTRSCSPATTRCGHPSGSSRSSSTSRSRRTCLASTLRSPSSRSEKILGLNAAALYDIDVPAELQLAEPPGRTASRWPREPRRACRCDHRRALPPKPMILEALGDGHRSRARRAHHRSRVRHVRCSSTMTESPSICGCRPHSARRTSPT